MTLAPEKLALLTFLTQARTVEQICDASSLPDFEACRTLWGYRVVGVVRRLSATGAPAAPEDDGLGP